MQCVESLAIEKVHIAKLLTSLILRDKNNLVTTRIKFTTAARKAPDPVQIDDIKSGPHFNKE